MILRFRPSLSLLLIAACTGRPSPSDTEGSTGTGGDTTAAPGTGGPPPSTEPPSTEPPSTEPTTTEPTTTTPTSVGSTTEDTSSEPTSTGAPDTTTSTSTGDDTTEDNDTTGMPPPGVCLPGCEELEVHEGSLELEPGASTDEFACVHRITGALTISGDVGPAALAGLARLERVNWLQITNNSALTNLDVFPCLRAVDESAVISGAPALTDASRLGQLHTLPSLSFNSTGLTALPTFGPDHAGLRFLSLNDNDSLVDLDPVAGWRALPGSDLDLDLEGNAGLTSIEGLAGIITDAAGATVGVRLVELPKLASLAGLEPLKNGWLQGTGLPLVPDLLPLSGMTSFGWIELFDMPLVTDLKGLHNLVSVTGLILGACVNALPDGPGMPGLNDLSGLDKLETVHILGIANNIGMTALTGAPALKSLSDLQLVNNPGLAQADVDAFVGQLDAQPMSQCFGGWDECPCVVILPP